MPPAEPNSFLHHALEPNQHRLSPIITGHNDLSVTWQDRELFFAAVATAAALLLQLRVPAIHHHRTLHRRFKHFKLFFPTQWVKESR